MFRLRDYHFDLPPELIARFPPPTRGDSRLMIVDRSSGKVAHASFRDFPQQLDSRTFLVMNNTRVVPARLLGELGGKKVEMLIVRWLDEFRAEALAKPANRFRVGASVSVSPDISARVEEAGEWGRRWLRFSTPRERVMAAGYAPLPPYIKRRHQEADRFRSLDLERYQTVYAAQPGAIAAPTAGLHFSRDILERTKRRCPVLEVTLEVGEATFQAIRAEDIRNLRLGKERVRVERETGERIREYKAAGKKLLAVGTTSVRAIESWARIKPAAEDFDTDLAIYPGFSFSLVDRLLTNFHLPESSLFILVSAFAGIELVQEAYRIAVEQRYRFFSYGDAMLIV